MMEPHFRMFSASPCRGLCKEDREARYGQIPRSPEFPPRGFGDWSRLVRRMKFAVVRAIDYADRLTIHAGRHLVDVREPERLQKGLGLRHVIAIKIKCSFFGKPLPLRRHDAINITDMAAQSAVLETPEIGTSTSGFND